MLGCHVAEHIKGITDTQQEITTHKNTQKLVRYPDIQGLRAVAVLSVVAFHSGLIASGGFTGVDIFFVISGFVITKLIVHDLEAHRFSVFGFLLRRMRRLLPAFLVVLSYALVSSFLFESPCDQQDITGKTAIGGVLLTANIAILRYSGGYFDAPTESNMLLHTWSLSVEEQFYILLPIVILAIWRFHRARRTKARWCVASLSILVGVSFILSFILSYRLAPTSTGYIYRYQSLLAFYSMPSRAWEFCAGSLVSLWTIYPMGFSWCGRHVSRVRIAQWIAATGLTLSIGSLLFISQKLPYPGTAALVPVTATVCLIVAGRIHSDNSITRILSHPLLCRIGDMSYSIYLWHWPTIVAATLIWPSPITPILAAGVSFFFARISFKYIEQPIRCHRLQRPLWIILTAFVCTCTVGLAALSLIQCGTKLIPLTQQYRAEAKILTLGRRADCMLSASRLFTDQDTKRCVFGDQKIRHWIMLAGDSHADAISDGVVIAGNRQGFNVMALTGAGCRLTRSAKSSQMLPNCPELSNTLLDLATKSANKPSLVIISHWDSENYRDNKNWIVELHHTLVELENAGVRVLLVTDVPNYAIRGARISAPCFGGFANFTCGLPESEVLDIHDDGVRRRDIHGGLRTTVTVVTV